MGVLLLGGTGRLGKVVLEVLLQKGFEVNILVRSPEKVSIQNSNLNIFKGIPTNATELEQAMQKCDAIINVLNVSRTSDFPWARLRTPETFLSDTMRNLVEVSARQNVQRVVVCSAWGAAETKKEIPGWFRWFIDNSNMGAAYRDHERQELLIMKSNLKWTIVRPVGLTNSQKEKPIIVSYNNSPKPKMTISRVNVARYMVNAVSDDSLIHRSPTISS